MAVMVFGQKLIVFPVFSAYTFIYIYSIVVPFLASVSPSALAWAIRRPVITRPPGWKSNKKTKESSASHTVLEKQRECTWPEPPFPTHADTEERRERGGGRV